MLVFITKLMRYQSSFSEVLHKESNAHPDILSQTIAIPYALVTVTVMMYRVVFATQSVPPDCQLDTISWKADPSLSMLFAYKPGTDLQAGLMLSQKPFSSR